NGLLGMINQHSWMFLSSYEKLREKLIDQTQFDTLLHLGPRTFPEIGGEVVQNAAFTFVNKKPNVKSSYIRLIDYKDTYLKSDKTLEAIKNSNFGWFYTKNQKDFKKIPGNNTGYWVHQGIISLFDNSKKLSEIIFADGQNKTGNNEKYLRLLWEINKRDLGIGHKFIFYAKGGHFRKWHGNIDFSVKWDSISRKFYSKNKIARIIKKEYWYREGFTFSRMAKKTNGRVLDKRGTFDATTISFYIREKEAEKYNYLLGLFNSVVVDYFIKILNPTLVFQLRDVRNIPFKNTQKDEIPF